MRNLSSSVAAATLLLGLASIGSSAPISGAKAQTSGTTTQQAYRFLAQASFGARPADIKHLVSDLNFSYSAWLNEQIANPIQFSYATISQGLPCSVAQSQTISTATKNTVTAICPTDVSQTFWLGAVFDNNQLRQRVAFALSQILVISVDDGSLGAWGDASAAYEDILYRDAFVNFRVLLNDISNSDAMGKFLSFLYNVQGTPPTATSPGTVPDQNFAREVMQLFTIGLVQLDSSGEPILDPKTGQPIPTYSQNDVVGASNVMTGFGPYDDPKDIAWDFKYNGSLYGRENYQFRPTNSYSQYHSTIPKSFLGVTIPAQKTADPVGDLNTFLDTLFNHPNVGPFVGKQLIQRLVTSNPSPAYVSRVAAVFNNNGAGVRGDLSAVVKAILLDPEARSDSSITSPSFGKLREPILRMAQLLRVLGGATGADGTFGFAPYDPTQQLGQYPFRAGSVFNFYYPNFTPPLSALAANDLVSPEMQITTTETVYRLDQFLAPIFSQAGWYVNGATPGYAFTLDYYDWLPYLESGTLVDQLNLVFMSGQMSTTLKNDLLAAIKATIGGPQPQLAQALRILFDSPEYIVQK